MLSMSILSDFTTLSLNETDKSENFELFQLKKGGLFQKQDKEYYYLFFLLEGRGELCMEGSGVQPIHPREFILLPQLSRMSYKAKATSRIVLFSFKYIPTVFDKPFLASLFAEANDYRHRFNPLPFCEALDNFIILLTQYVKDGISLSDICEMKVQELFSLFRYYYTRKDLIELFYPLICNTDEFRRKVMENYRKVSGAGELMAACGLKRTSFERKFKQEFGMSAHQWILKKKAEVVRESLADPDLTIEEVRLRHNFNSATHFVRFCRQQFNDTPSEFRKKLMNLSI